MSGYEIEIRGGLELTSENLLPKCSHIAPSLEQRIKHPALIDANIPPPISYP
jgi:hypothetical protein